MLPAKEFKVQGEGLSVPKQTCDLNSVAFPP